MEVDAVQFDPLMCFAQVALAAWDHEAAVPAEQGEHAAAFSSESCWPWSSRWLQQAWKLVERLVEQQAQRQNLEVAPWDWLLVDQPSPGHVATELSLALTSSFGLQKLCKGTGTAYWSHH